MWFVVLQKVNKEALELFAYIRAHKALYFCHEL